MWETDDTGRFDQETAQAGVRAFVEFLRELELPTEDSELDDALWCRLEKSASAVKGTVYGSGVYQKDEVMDTKAFQEAYQPGKKL